MRDPIIVHTECKQASVSLAAKLSNIRQIILTPWDGHRLLNTYRDAAGNLERGALIISSGRLSSQDRSHDNSGKRQGHKQGTYESGRVCLGVPEVVAFASVVFLWFSGYSLVMLFRRPCECCLLGGTQKRCL